MHIDDITICSIRSKRSYFPTTC